MNFKDALITRYNLSETDWESTMVSFHVEPVKSKSYFLKEGQISRKLGFIKSGLFRSFIWDQNGNDITTHFFLPGTVLLSIESFNNQVPSKENIAALECSELLIVTYDDLHKLYQTVPAWQQICKDVAEMKNQVLNTRSIQFQTLTAKERYKKFCETYPEIMQKVTLRHIASYLGIDSATLSRIRKNI